MFVVDKYTEVCTDIESNSYTLGPYLRDNSDEIYLSLDVRPLSYLLFKYSYSN